jgi:hypothetical protein
MPEIVMLQRCCAEKKVTNFADALLAGQVFAEKFARHGYDEY